LGGFRIVHMDQPEPRLWRISAVARRLGLNPRRLRAAVRRGEVRAYLVDGWLSTTVADVEEYVARHEYQPGNREGDAHGG